MTLPSCDVLLSRGRVAEHATQSALSAFGVPFRRTGRETVPAHVVHRALGPTWSRWLWCAVPPATGASRRAWAGRRGTSLICPPRLRALCLLLADRPVPRTRSYGRSRHSSAAAQWRRLIISDDPAHLYDNSGRGCGWRQAPCEQRASASAARGLARRGLASVSVSESVLLLAASPARPHLRRDPVWRSCCLRPARC